MSISERQYTKILSEELLKYLLEGKVPDTTEIANKVSAALSKNGNVTYRYFPQPNKDTFQIDQYNNALKQIKFDIDTFQEELLDMFADSVKRINYADLYHKIHSYELNNLQSKLEAILFSIENADYYFLNAYDNFTDNSKIDTEQSTVEVLNVSEHLLHLPYGSRSTKRISTSHLIEYPSWSVNIVTPESSVVYTKRDIAGSKFGSIFTDSLEAWNYEVLTTQNVPVSIEFAFPLAGAAEEELEVFVNRFEILSQSIANQNVKLEVSTDNVNYLAPLGYEQGINMLDSNRTYAMDFETNLVQYVKITLTKRNADQTVTIKTGEGNNKEFFQYVFGLKSIAAFTTGRVLNATYTSKPFSFDGNTNISKISIKSDYIKPQGTDLSYSIALTEADGTLATDYIPINPVGTQLKASALNTITFENNLSKSQRFSVNLSSTKENLSYGSSYRNRYLYKILDDLNPSPIFNGIELTRGYGAWARDTTTKYNNITVPDCYLNFSYSETESLYSLKTESCTFEKIISSVYPLHYLLPPHPTQGATIDFPLKRDIKLTLSQNPYFDLSKGHLIRPSYNTNGAPVSSPNYAIHKVKHLQATKQTTIDFIESHFYYGTAPNVSIFITLPVTNFLINSNNQSLLPKFKVRIFNAYNLVAGLPAYVPLTTPIDITLIEGTDYTIETTLVDNIPMPTGRLKLLPHSGNTQFLNIVPAGSIAGGISWQAGYLLPRCTFTMTYTPEIDITHKIESLEGRVVTLGYCDIPQSDAIEVTYRYLVTSPDEIIRSSILVYDKPSTVTSRSLYQEGVDYLVNASTNVIRRIESGNISSTGGVYIEYKFKSADINMEIFTTWCKIDNPSGTQIRFDLESLVKKNRLVVDSVKGEALYVSGPFGLVDITNAAGTPSMPPGWVQFIVKSKNPSINSAYKSNLIDQVIQLRDVNRQKIFKEGNIYFSSILAYRNLMIERTLNHLKVNTLASDNQSFAIDDITNPDKSTVVVNFFPNNTNDLYNYAPTSNEDAENKPVKIPETYLVSWLYPNEESKVKSNNLVVRIDLSRDPNVDGALTPKVHNYQVRVGL